ncbi:MAG TPA: alpha/beta fold hydrolase, partial [Acetobacteraceae bacterium]
MILNAIQTGKGPPVVLLHGLFGSARNFGAIQRALTPLFRVIALDARNHGASPHAAGMQYTTMAADVLETLTALGVGSAAVVGHSMGGKIAMALALHQPDTVQRLLVADIAPATYQHHNDAIAAAMRAVALTPGLGRGAADAALAAAVPQAGIRAFLLQNLQLGPAPHWRIGIDEIAAAIPDLEGWEELDGIYAGPTVFVTGASS